MSYDLTLAVTEKNKLNVCYFICTQREFEMYFPVVRVPYITITIY